MSYTPDNEFRNGLLAFCDQATNEKWHTNGTKC